LIACSEAHYDDSKILIYFWADGVAPLFTIEIHNLRWHTSQLRIYHTNVLLHGFCISAPVIKTSIFEQKTSVNCTYLFVKILGNFYKDNVVISMPLIESKQLVRLGIQPSVVASLSLSL
jgi:hypothetical protein